MLCDLLDEQFDENDNFLLFSASQSNQQENNFENENHPDWLDFLKNFESSTVYQKRVAHFFEWQCLWQQ